MLWLDWTFKALTLILLGYLIWKMTFSVRFLSSLSSSLFQSLGLKEDYRLREVEAHKREEALNKRIQELAETIQSLSRAVRPDQPLSNTQMENYLKYLDLMDERNEKKQKEQKYAGFNRSFSSILPHELPPLDEKQ